MTNVWYKQGEALLSEIQRTDVPEDMFALWPTGQMSVVLKWRKTVLYIDPVLADLCGEQGKSCRCYQAPYTPAMAKADVVLCTHSHGDHMQPETLQGMHDANPQCLFIVPAPEVPFALSLGLSQNRVLGAVAGQPISLGDGLRVVPVAAAHETYRQDEHGNEYALGYVINMGALSCYHSGDTLLTQKLLDDLRAQGTIDVACLPVNGCDFERHTRGIVGNMDALDSAYLAHAIAASLVVPMHFDMVRGNTSDPLQFAAVMRSRYPADRYHIPVLGERLLIAR